MEYKQSGSRTYDTLPRFADDWALFLDVDGTLLDIALRPQDVSPWPGLPDVLKSLVRRVPLALISGRRIADLDCLFAPLVLPIAGQHGAERRSIDGRTTCRPVSRVDLEQARHALARWADAHPGILVEDKGLSLALHYRMAPELGADAAAVARQVTRSLPSPYDIVAGKMVWEIRPAGCDKGGAMAAFMDEQPFSGRVPIFIGDDVGDENGFSLINARGGHSFKVGAGRTAARFCFAGVGEVVGWLSDYAAWLEATPEET